MKLSEPNIAILRYMAKRGEAEAPSEAAFYYRRFGQLSVEGARRRAKTLAKHGYLEPLGETATGERCYGITDKGRAALQEMEGE